MQMKATDIHRKVVDRLNATHPSADRSVLVTQTVYATIEELKDAGFIETEGLHDDGEKTSSAASHE